MVPWNRKSFAVEFHSVMNWTQWDSRTLFDCKMIRWIGRPNIAIANYPFTCRNNVQKLVWKLLNKLVYCKYRCFMMAKRSSSITLTFKLHNPQVFYLLQSRPVQAWSPWQWMMTSASFNMRRPTPAPARVLYRCVPATNLSLPTSPWSRPTRTSRRGWGTRSGRTPCWGREWSSWRIRYRCKRKGRWWEEKNEERDSSVRRMN